MKSEFQIEGYWWLPGKPENKVAGIFHYKPNEVGDLRLLGDLNSDEDFITNHLVTQLEPPIVILGENENAANISLFILGYGRRHWNFSSSFPIIHYNVQFCIKGMHLASKNDNVFNEITESLTSWINLHPVKIEIPFKEGKLTKDFTLSFSGVQNNLSFDINNGFEF